MAGLSSIPFYSGWLERGEQHQREDLGKLQQAQGLMAMIGQAQQQQQRQAAAEREAAYRAGLRPDMTPEEQVAHAANYSGPEAVMRVGTSHLDRMAADKTRQAGIAATREAAMARLSLQAEGIQRAHEAKMLALNQSGANDAVKAAEVERHNRMKESFQAYAQRVAGEKLFWETGARVDSPGASVNGGAPATAGPQREQFVDIPASDRQAYEMARSGVSASPNRQVAPEELARMAQMPGAQAPAAVPEQEFSAGPVQTVAPDNLDARDLRLQQLGATPAAPVAAPAAAAPVAPQMPQFSGSPRQKAEAENKWRLQQAQVEAKAKTDSQKIQMGGPNALTDRDKDYYAAYVMANGRMPIGLSRIGPEAIQSIMSRVSERAAEMGMKPEDFAIAGPVVRTKLGALMQFEKNVNAIQAYEGMLVKNIDILGELSAKLPRNKSPLLNRPMNWVEQNLAGDPAMAEYLFQVKTVATEIARVLNNPNLTGQLTDTATKELDAIVKGTFNHAQLMQVLDRAKADAQNRSKSLDDQKAKVIQEIRGVGIGGAKPSATSTGGWRVVR